MSKFGLDSPVDDESRATRDLSERLANFPAVTTRHSIDLHAADEAAAAHGFVSREPLVQEVATLLQPRTRRRMSTVEPTRHLAVRLTEAQYSRFVAYADVHQLTYQDAIVSLLDKSGH